MTGATIGVKRANADGDNANADEAEAKRAKLAPTEDPANGVPPTANLLPPAPLASNGH